MDALFFESWNGLLRIIIVGVAAYTALVIVLRITGKRTLSKMNAFDLVITVALGSALSSTILSKSTPLLEGITGMILLVLLQYVVTFWSVRAPGFESLMKAEPSMLVHRGSFLAAAMRQNRVTESEILAALREAGLAGLRPEVSVVLETDGSLSVIKQQSGNPAENLAIPNQDRELQT